LFLFHSFLLKIIKGLIIGQNVIIGKTLNRNKHCVELIYILAKILSINIGHMKGIATRILSVIASTVFLAIVFFFAFYYLDPSLVYFKQQPLFLVNKFFLFRYLNEPGGMAAYLSLFLSQFFHSRLVGSILLTLVAGLILFLSHQVLIRFFSRLAAFFLQFVPALLFMALHSHYNFDFQPDIPLIITFVFALAYYKIIHRPLFFRMIFLVLADGLLFWSSGSMSVFIFSTLIIVSEMYFKHENFFRIPALFQLIMCILLVLFILFASQSYRNNAGLPGAVFPDLNKSTLATLWVFFGILPFLVLIPVLTSYVPGIHHFFNRFSTRIGPGILSALTWVLAAIIPCMALLVCMISFDRHARDAIQIHALAANGQWNRVLETANRLSLADRKVIFQVNRALYHLDRLPDEAFSYPQLWGEKGLVLTSNYSRDVLMLCSDLYFDMGHVKESLHWAYEAQTKQEQSPEVLKRIALCNLIIGQYPVAGKFFTILSRSVVHRKWAMHYLDCLKKDTLIEEDPLVKEKRKLLPRHEFYANTDNPQYDLYMLFTENPDNKMAFEYFMMYSLLKQDLSELVLNLKYMGQLRYNKIPVHIEEGIILFMTLNKTYPVELGKYKISNLTRKRFAGYSSIMMKYRKDMKAARADLYNGFGNSYWYYIHYVSPITTQRKTYEKVPE
jgi:Family of unknown function (DUF6057)